MNSKAAVSRSSVPHGGPAQLEGSKVFAKQFMERHGIPTAPVFGIFDSPEAVRGAARSLDWPLVIKAGWPVCRQGGARRLLLR